jgi:hypothetical protein
VCAALTATRNVPAHTIQNRWGEQFRKACLTFFVSPYCISRWSEEEEEALQLGVRLYGEGKWKRILTDTALAKYFVDRSNVDLKVVLLPVYIFPFFNTPELKDLMAYRVYSSLP